MRKLVDLVLLFLRRNLAGSGLILVGFPLVMILFVLMTSSDTTATVNTTIVNLDQGEHAAAMLDAYEFELSQIDEEAQARTLLASRESDSVYIIPAEFSSLIEAGEVPELVHLTRPDSTAIDPAFSLYLQTSIRDLVQAHILDAAGILSDFTTAKWTLQIEEDRVSGREATAIILITFSILYGSALLGTDLVNQRKNKVLYRGLATPTRASTVLASNVIGAWIAQAASNLVAILIIARLMGFSIHNLWVLILMTAVLCFYSVCQQLLFLRLFKNPQLSMFVGMMLAVFMMFLAMLSDMKDLLSSIPELIFNIAYISPFYWVMEAFDRSSPWMPAAMLLLLALALFVAGGFRVREFAD